MRPSVTRLRTGATIGSSAAASSADSTEWSSPRSSSTRPKISRSRSTGSDWAATTARISARCSRSQRSTVASSSASRFGKCQYALPFVAPTRAASGSTATAARPPSASAWSAARVQSSRVRRLRSATVHTLPYGRLRTVPFGWWWTLIETPDTPWEDLTGIDRHEACLRAARAGDRKALDALVADLTPLIWHVARGNGLDRQAAVDVAQNVWLGFLRHLHRMREPRALVGRPIVA